MKHQRAINQNEKERLSADEVIIIRTLLYFDIFNYPLTREEIRANCPVKLPEGYNLEKILARLVVHDKVRRFDQYYCVNGDNNWVKKRESGNLRAGKYLKAARRMSRFLSNFPYVRAISLSGSLSKGVMEKDSDIDYFIITKPNRLWLSRTMMILFKKIFLLNSRKWLCANYFIDDQSLKIPDENIFAATEIVYLIPTFNYDLHKKFLSANEWVKWYKPNFHPNGKEYVVQSKPFWIKNILEYLLNGKFGDWLDDLCFDISTKFWRRKFKYLDKKEFNHALRSHKNVSKHHPQNFQKIVLSQLKERERRFEEDHYVKLAN